jgi:hypothetical protein
MVKDVFRSIPFQFGNVLLSMWLVIVLSVSLTEYVPKQAPQFLNYPVIRFAWKNCHLMLAECRPRTAHVISLHVAADPPDRSRWYSFRFFVFADIRLIDPVRI